MDAPGNLEDQIHELTAKSDSFSGITKYVVMGVAVAALIGFVAWQHALKKREENAALAHTWAMLLDNNDPDTNSKRMHWGSAAGLQGTVAKVVQLGSARVARLSEVQSAAATWTAEAEGASNMGWMADGNAYYVGSDGTTLQQAQGVTSTNPSSTAYIWALVSANTLKDAREVAYAAGVSVLASAELPAPVDTSTTLNVPTS